VNVFPDTVISVGESGFIVIIVVTVSPSISVVPGKEKIRLVPTFKT
jgi:hypothetical protein